MAEGKRILLVDDEADILTVVIFRLKQAGYEVFTAEEARRGLELAREYKPDLILLDLRLPGMDGGEACRRLKSDDSLKRIPVILLTASATSNIGDKVKEIGADDYMIKPFEPEELLKKVSIILGKIQVV